MTLRLKFLMYKVIKIPIKLPYPQIKKHSRFFINN